MSALGDYLAAELEKKVSQHGLVVWQDDACQYSGDAASLCPPDAHFAAYDGSWYALRREIEPYMAAESPPKLVVYVHRAAPASDPLEEIRAAGAAFSLSLRVLVRKALAGQLSDRRLAEIGKAARTLAEAESAVAGEAGNVRLISALGASDSRTMMLRVLTGERAAELDAEDAWSAAAELLSDELGGDLSGAGDELREACLRQMVLTEVAGEGAKLPKTLMTAWGPVTPEQRQRTTEMLLAWQADPAGRGGYAEISRRVDDALGLRQTLTWSEGLVAGVGSRAADEAVFDEAVRRLSAGDPGGASDLAKSRLAVSPWVRPQGPAGEDWSGLAAGWRSVQATAELRLAIDAAADLSALDCGQILDAYVAGGWTVDRTYRRFEIACNALRVHGELESAFAEARLAYEEWLDESLLAFSAAVERQGFEVGKSLRQGSIHATWVRDAPGPVAYVWVDALRFELGADLAEGLRADGHEVQLHSAIASVPTITKVGMASLTPEADSGLTLTMSDGDLSIAIGGSEVGSVPQRIARLRAAHGGKVLDRTLDVVAGQGEKELKRALGDTDLLLVRSQELDAAGESGMLNAAWAQFTVVLELLRNLVARLGQAGIKRVVIAADHGFVTLSRGIGSDRSIDPPAGGLGALHRRDWVGKGAATTESTLRTPLSSTGLPSDLDLIAPRGLAVFKAGGAKQFFHGGLSPQELVVPVLVIDSEAAPAPTQFRVHVSIAGGRITTGAFAATLEFSGDLFTSGITVRVVAQGDDAGQPIARVVSGDGYDPATGAIELRADAPAPILTFQVTSNLERDKTVEIQVLDARTGLLLGGAEAVVAAPVVVDDL